MAVQFAVRGDYIQLDQLLKAAGLVDSGGAAHAAVEQGQVRVDGAVESRKRAKLRPGQRVRFAGEEIELTAAEFRLLRYFLLHPQQLLSKSHLAEHMYDGETERDSNVLEVQVNRLRGKLGREVIETKRGQGYRFTGVGG